MHCDPLNLIPVISAGGGAPFVTRNRLCLGARQPGTHNAQSPGRSGTFPSAPGSVCMIKLALICLVVAAVAAILGFGGVAGAFVDIAIWLAVIAAVLFVIFLVLGIFAGKKASDALD